MENVYKYPKTPALDQALNDFLATGYKLETVPLKTIIKDNDLNPELDASKFIPDDAEYWGYTDAMFAVHKGNKYKLGNGHHRCIALYNDGYDAVELPVLTEAISLDVFKKDPDLAREILKDVKATFGFIDPTESEATYLLNSGRFLDTKGPFANHQHINIANYIEEHYDIDDVDPINNGSKFMLHIAHAVRITYWKNDPGIKGICLPVMDLTGPQYDNLAVFLNKIAHKVTKNTPLFIATARGSSQIEYDRGDNLAERVIQDIHAYYTTRRLEGGDLDFNEDYKVIYDTILVYVSDRYNGGGFNQEIPVINGSISETIKKYKQDLGPGYWVEYQGPGKTHRAEPKKKQPSFYQGSLFEDTRSSLINNSKNAGAYKDQSHGKNRFERKRLSKIANTVKQYNQIDMNQFFKQDTLQVNIPVIGETDTYDVTIKMSGIVAEMARLIKNNKNQLEYKTIVQALTKVFNSSDVYVKCSCDDFKYRFAHWNIIRNVSVDDTDKDPGPGKGKANPNDDKGRGCKHILLVLANSDWIMKVTSVINNYIHYVDENLRKAFLTVIFPKLYGTVADAAEEQDLVPEDTELMSDKSLIDTINDYGKNRGKYQKGSNKNPVTGTGGRTKKEEPKEDEENAEEGETESEK